VCKVTDEELAEDTGDVVADELRSIEQAAREARNAYESLRGVYEDFARSLAAVFNDCLSERDVAVHSVTYRAKDPESFQRKASLPSPDNPTLPKYRSPLEEIVDQAGVRITTYFLSTVDAVSEIVAEQFEVLERVAKASSEPDRLGYQSIHYLIKYSDMRTSLPEYRRFAGMVAEVQVRTILQHAWAEIEHDIQYKAVATLPTRVRRRFAALAGLIEIADREFQAIEDQNRVIREEARRNVDLGQLERVEITRDSVRAYLNRKYGSDGRMSDFSYDWTARLLLRLGFTNLAQVDECIRDRNDDQISRIIYGSRQGQLTRFELVLLASMGEGFILAHPWADRSNLDNWFFSYEAQRLVKLRTAGVHIGNYRPPGYPDVTLKARELATQIELATQAFAAQEDDASEPTDC